MTSRSGAEDAAVPEDPGSGAEEGHRGHGTKEEVHELQREEAELVKDEAEGKDFVLSAESRTGLPGLTRVCVSLCVCAVEEGGGEAGEGAPGGRSFREQREEGQTSKFSRQIETQSKSPVCLTKPKVNLPPLTLPPSLLSTQRL